MYKRLLYLLLPVLMLATSSCLDTTDFDAEDEKKILEYLKSNSLEAQKNDYGIYYIITVPGSDQKPTALSTIKVNYRGKLLNGNVFDSTFESGKPYEMKLSDAILGWQLTIPYYGKGGKGMLFIPSRYGYGNFAIGNIIPAHSVLIFDIELIDFR